MDAIRYKLAMTALSSRMAIISLSVVANALIPDHDAGVFAWTVTPAPSSGENNETDAVTLGTVDRAVSFLTDGLSRWDGQYFLHIANNGYSYENTLAFFPLFPLSLRAAGDVVHWLQAEYGFLHISSALRLAGVAVNVACFVGACLSLYELTARVLRDDYLAYRAALLFCWNPASIFFSAYYSESLYCFLTFYALSRLERGFSVQTAIFFAAATACRSNALVNLGFILYKGLRLAFREAAIHRRLRQLDRAELSETLTNVAGDAVVPAVLSAALAGAPFVLFQWYAFTQFCGLTKPKNDFAPEVLSYAEEYDLKLPSSEPSEWCYHRLPLAYSYIQSRYWDVGFLRYFELKQVPNFLLAAPILYLVLSQSYKFFSRHRFYCLRLGCTYFGMDPAQRVPPFDMYLHRTLPKVFLLFK